MNFDAVKAGKGLTERSACKRLARLAARVPADQAIVELGAYQGRTTAWLAYGASTGRGAPVFAVDPWGDVEAPDYADRMEPGYAEGRYASAFEDFDAHMDACDASVMSIRQTAADAGNDWTGVPVGLLWHDAQHTAEAVRADLQAWMPHLAPGAVVALHDVCQKEYGVLEGATVLDTPDFDWAGRTVHPWRKHPDRRGMLVVKRC